MTDNPRIDYKKITNTINKPWLIILLLLLIPTIIAYNLRTHGSTLPQTDNWAQQTVTTYYKNTIIDQINTQYPNLPADRKNTLANEEYDKFYTTNKQNIDQQINQQSQYYKNTMRYPDAQGNPDAYPYMPDIDPYHFLRYARNLDEKGQYADEIRNGTLWDNHMNAPIGTSIGTETHVYALYGLYKIMHAANNRITLMQSSNYFPAIIICLSIIPAFFLARRIAGNIAGLFAAMIIATSTAILIRTTWGHADTDAYNILFPLLITWIYYEIYETKKTWQQITLATLLALTLAIYSVTWVGWWYIFDFILFAMIANITYQLFLNRKKLWQYYWKSKEYANLSATLLTTFFGTWLFSKILGYNGFWTIINGPLNFITIKAASTASLWPNVLTTVAELNPSNLTQVIQQNGGPLYFIITLIGFAIIALKKDENNKLDIKHSTLLILWFASTIYAAIKGVRFSILVTPTIAIGFGVAIGSIINYAKNKSHKIHIHPTITLIILVLLASTLFIKPIKDGYTIATQDVPMINDAWYDSLTLIKNQSQPNAIINSWWDFGHHFKWYADRAVTFDGASQVGPQAHWIGKVLLTDNEKQAIGILRMLDCGANEAFYTLDTYINYTPKSVEILYDIVTENKSQAQQELAKHGLTPQQAQNVLKYTHCQPPEDYFITSQDMVGKSGVWGHFGSWDFHKADMWTNLRQMPKEQAINHIMQPQYNYGYTKQEAEKLYAQMNTLPNEDAANQWIAPWPGYYQQNSCQKNNDTINCGFSTTNITTGQTTINTNNGPITPKTIIYTNQEKQLTIQKTNETNDVGISLYNDNTQAYLQQTDITTSIFNRLFYYDGTGLEHFQKISDKTDITGARIIVWKINWKEFQ